jgi:hypothetical protein
MKNLFKTKPTEAIVQKAIHSIGFTSFTDSKAINDSMVQQTIIEELKVELKDFYYGVFYKKYIQRDFSFQNWITVVRQLLKSCGYTLLRGEKCKRIETNVYNYVPFYRISPMI